MKAVCAAFITGLQTVWEPEALLKFKNEFARLRTLDGNQRRPSATPRLAELAASDKTKVRHSLPLHRLPDIEPSNMEGTLDEP